MRWSRDHSPQAGAAFPLAIGKARQESLKGWPCSFQGRISTVLILQAFHAALNLFRFLRRRGLLTHRRRLGLGHLIQPAPTTEPVHELRHKTAMLLTPAHGSPEAIQSSQQNIQDRNLSMPPEPMPRGAGQFFRLLARIGSPKALENGIGRKEIPPTPFPAGSVPVAPIMPLSRWGVGGKFFLDFS